VARSHDGPCFCRLTINAGSRDDLAGHPGLAHFVEHTVFRGTGRRSGYQINARAENVGGALNAYTSREETVYYVVTPTGELSRALELLADVVGNPSFPPAELEREKTIICEEIKSDSDAPDEAIFDDLARLLYPDSTMGNNILGTMESVQAMTSADARTFVDRLYTPANMVLSCVADMPASALRHMIERRMSAISPRPTVQERRELPPAPRFIEVRDRNLQQSHTVMATRIFGLHDPRRYAMTLLRYHLGGGMNSVLFHELRDKRGYVYSVDASANMYSDTGNFYIYFGSAHENVDKCRRLITRLLEKLAENPMKPATFARLRRNFAGRTEILNSAMNKRAGLAARELLRYGRVTSRAEQLEIMNSITAEQVRECAALIVDRGLSVLSYR